MRFIHFSDSRIGGSWENKSRWSMQRKAETAATLVKVMEKAKEISADFVIISGGLFAHCPVTSELEDVNRVFSELRDTKIIIIAGETDRIMKNSPIRSFRWAENVHFIADPQGEVLEFSDLNTTFYGISLTAYNRDNPDLLVRLAKADKSKSEIKIAMAYGKDVEDLARRIDVFPFTYVALGGSGTFTEIKPNKIYSSGCLEPENMTEAGEHGILIGETGGINSSVRSVEFIPMASASYIPLVININPQIKTERLEKMLKEEMAKRGEQNIYKIRLKGVRDADEDFTFASLEKTYRIKEIVDETKPYYDYYKLRDEHANDVIGVFAEDFQNNEHHYSEIEKKATYYGIDALLKTM